jgi:hypothetical protein
LSVFIGIVAILSLFSVAAAFSKPRDPNDDRRWIIYAVSVVVPICVAGCIYLVLQTQAKRMQTSSADSMMHFRIDGLEISTTLATAKTNWDAFHKVIEAPSDFIFYVQHNIYFGVPKRFLRNDIEIDDLRKILSQNLGNRVSLRSSI